MKCSNNNMIFVIPIIYLTTFEVAKFTDTDKYLGQAINKR